MLAYNSCPISCNKLINKLKIIHAHYFSIWQRSWLEICWRTWCRQKVGFVRKKKVKINMRYGKRLKNNWNGLVFSVWSPVFSPLLRLSPPPSDHDYIYNLDETEGLCDLFDVPILNLWPLHPHPEWKEGFHKIVTVHFQKNKQKKKKQKNTSPPWGCSEVQQSRCDGTDDAGRLCSGSAGAWTRGRRHAASGGIAGENKTFYFSGKKTNDNSIFGLCIIKA